MILCNLPVLREPRPPNVCAALAVSVALHRILISVRLADKTEVRRLHIRKWPDLFSTPRYQAADPDLPDPLMDKAHPGCRSGCRSRHVVGPRIIPKNRTRR